MTGRSSRGRPGPAPRAPGLPGGQDGEQAALGAAAGQRADGAGSAAEQREGGADQVVLDARDARERGRVEGVGPLERRLGAGGQVVDVGTPGVVDVGHRGAAVRGHVAGLQRGQFGQHVLRAHAGSPRHRAGSGRARARRPARAAPGTTVNPSRTASHGGRRTGRPPRPRWRTRSRPARAGRRAAPGPTASPRVSAAVQTPVKTPARRSPDDGLVGGDDVGQHRQREHLHPGVADPDQDDERDRGSRAAVPDDQRAGPRPRRTAARRRAARCRLPTPPADPQPQRHDEDRRRHEGDEQQRAGRGIPEDLLGVVRHAGEHHADAQGLDRRSR